MLLVSAGDVYGGSDAYNRPKCRFIARMMKRFGVDAVALGEMDLNFGLDAIEQDNRDMGMNIICANVFPKARPGVDGAATDSGGSAATEPVFPPYRVIERGGVRFGVIAVLSPAAKNERVASESGEVEALTYVIKAPRPILEEVVPVVDAQSDFVLLLAHMTKSELSEALAGLQGIDMIILGHSAKPQVTAEPVWVDSIPTYMASHQGQYLGRARVSFDGQRRVSSTANQIRLLDDSIGSDAETARLVKEFEEENRRYQKEIFVKEQFSENAARGATRDTYVGLAACQKCHPSAFDSYTRTKHARAYATLSGLFMHRDSGCIPCHSTGYGEPGGFEGARVRGTPVDLVDVQCEACHGPGAEHKRDGTYKEKARESCTKCHTAEQDTDFDYAREWEKIAH